MIQNRFLDSAMYTGAQAQTQASWRYGSEAHYGPCVDRGSTRVGEDSEGTSEDLVAYLQTRAEAVETKITKVAAQMTIS